MPAIALQVENAEIVRSGLEDLEAEIPLVGRKQLRDTLNRALKRLRKPGRKSNSPVQWDTKKQRRAYFATEGFGRGIPTRRTNEYVQAWQIIKTENGYMLTNPLPQAKFIGGGPFGGGQSRIHQDRWELFREVFVEETENLKEEVQEQVRIVAQAKGFS